MMMIIIIIIIIAIDKTSVIISIGDSDVTVVHRFYSRKEN